MLHALCNTVDQVGGATTGSWIDDFMQMKGKSCTYTECEARGIYIHDDATIEKCAQRYAMRGT